MSDRDFDDISRIDRDMRSVQQILQDMESAKKPAVEVIEEMERQKAEAMNPARYADIQGIIHQVSASEQYRKMSEDMRGAMANAQTGVAEQVLQHLDIPDSNKSIAEAAQKFSLLSTSEAFTGAIQQSLSNLSDLQANINERYSGISLRQVTDLLNSTQFNNVLEMVNQTLAQRLSTETLAAIRYLTTKDLLHENWLDIASGVDLQNAVVRLQESSTGVLSRVIELAADAKVREIVGRIDQQILIDHATDLLYQENITIPQAVEVIYLGINSEILAALSGQKLHNFGQILLYLFIAYLVASSIPEFAEYAQKLHDVIRDGILLYSLLVSQMRLKKEMDEED